MMMILGLLWVEKKGISFLSFRDRGLQADLFWWCWSVMPSVLANTSSNQWLPCMHANSLQNMSSDFAPNPSSGSKSQPQRQQESYSTLLSNSFCHLLPPSFLPLFLSKTTRNIYIMMFASSAVRVASRQALAASTRRHLSSVATKTVAAGAGAGAGSTAGNRAAAPLLAAAGLAMTAAYFQRREVRNVTYCALDLDYAPAKYSISLPTQGCIHQMPIGRRFGFARCWHMYCTSKQTIQINHLFTNKLFHVFIFLDL